MKAKPYIYLYKLIFYESASPGLLSVDICNTIRDQRVIGSTNEISKGSSESRIMKHKRYAPNENGHLAETQQGIKK